MNLDAALLGADEAFDDDLVLIALILNKESVLGFIDEGGDAVASVAIAPDEKSLGVDGKGLAVPVVLEALNDFIDLLGIGGDDGIVAGVGQILKVPVEGLHEGSVVIDDHGFFVSDIEIGIGIDDLDTGGFEFLVGFRVFGFAIAAGGIEHDANVEAPFLGIDDGGNEVGVGEEEHFDANGFLGATNGIEERLGRVVGENDEGVVGHGASERVGVQ